ncbi:unnamed protein product [Moneuplotes crassus]|uniref:Uncharacterized protein n=1 Tax=Euplotes crassus TaxID=5936 RepID=A0AAD1UE01_EUPCR|nr:unnamed protein product [Moneuplotes crassus]
MDRQRNSRVLEERKTPSLMRYGTSPQKQCIFRSPSRSSQRGSLQKKGHKFKKNVRKYAKISKKGQNSSGVQAHPVRFGFSDQKIHRFCSNKKIPEKVLGLASLNPEDSKQNTSTANYMNFTAKSGRGDPDIWDIHEEDLSEITIQEEPLLKINDIRSFESRFNFSEKKGHKLHPDDFNLLKGYNGSVGYKSLREVSPSKRHICQVASKDFCNRRNKSPSPSEQSPVKYGVGNIKGNMSCGLSTKKSSTMKLRHLLSNDDMILSKYNNVRKIEEHEEIKEEQELSDSKKRSDESKQKDSMNSSGLQKNPFLKSNTSSPSYLDNETPDFLRTFCINNKKDMSQPRKKACIFNFKTLPDKRRRMQSAHIFSIKP